MWLKSLTKRRKQDVLGREDTICKKSEVEEEEKMREESSRSDTE